VFLSRPCVQTDAPPHSLHLVFRRPWLQIDAPPQSLQVPLIRPCPQIDDPPHSLQVVFRRPWLQTDAPPQSLHWFLGRPCVQTDDPPQSLHRFLWRPCSHFDWAVCVAPVLFFSFLPVGLAVPSSAGTISAPPSTASKPRFCPEPVRPGSCVITERREKKSPLPHDSESPLKC
jgi:hypothetical protein